MVSDKLLALAKGYMGSDSVQNLLDMLADHGLHIVTSADKNALGRVRVIMSKRKGNPDWVTIERVNEALRDSTKA